MKVIARYIKSKTTHTVVGLIYDVVKSPNTKFWLALHHVTISFSSTNVQLPKSCHQMQSWKTNIELQNNKSDKEIHGENIKEIKENNILKVTE